MKCLEVEVMVFNREKADEGSLSWLGLPIQSLQMIGSAKNFQLPRDFAQRVEFTAYLA